jgi:ribulose-phosphate 3-epimerase
MTDGSSNSRWKASVSASVMCIDWLNAGQQMETLKAAGIEMLHWDIMDGQFAPDFSMGSSIINQFRDSTDMRSDYHLMVEEPSRLFDAFELSTGDTVTIHQECCRNLHRDLVALRRRGANVGVALCPATPLDVLDYIIEDVDYILVMTVDPGYAGQPLVPQTLRKISDLKRIISNMGLDVRIGVDGNVNFENIPKMISAGADVLVAGSSGLFRKNFPLEDSLDRLEAAINEGFAQK